MKISGNGRSKTNVNGTWHKTAQFESPQQPMPQPMPKPMDDTPFDQHFDQQLQGSNQELESMGVQIKADEYGEYAAHIGSVALKLKDLHMLVNVLSKTEEGTRMRSDWVSPTPSWQSDEL